MKIHVLGWSGFTHSYSFALETYLRPFLTIPDVQLYFTHAMPYNHEWKKTRPSFLELLPSPTDSDTFDITFRMVYPYDYDPDPKSKITIVFTTCEYKVINNINGKYYSSEHKNVFILTPSIFSKFGLLRSDVPSEQIITIPHGLHHISISSTKEQLRQKYQIPLQSFVFFHNSSLTKNKNADYIFQSFSRLVQKGFPVVLMIKGCNHIYGSENKFQEYIHILPEHVQEKIYYTGEDLLDEQLAELYTLSDCYVSPYISEGFNLPVLEALSYGCQVICTRGGPTDEFAKDAFFIQSRVYTGTNIENEIELYHGKQIPKQVLFPSFPDFCLLMEEVLQHPKKFDPSFYSENYSEETISKMLYRTFQNLLYRL